MQVQADRGWQPTGMRLGQGDRIYVDAQGQWNASKNSLVMDSGLCSGEGRKGGASQYSRKWPLDCLIGQVGSGEPFFIGAQEVVTVNNPGELMLRINEADIFLNDNAGYLNVEVVKEVVRQTRAKPRNKPVAARPQPKPAYSNLIGDRWAVIVGISRYRDTRIPSLRYAADDARAFYKWTISQTGGKFSPDRVNLLVDEQATYAAIKRALFEWLKQALEEDVVIIYFAGHGSPESPDSMGNLFLLPYDTQYDSIATTGFPMWDIETALKRFIKAKKVVVIADACHSGGVGESFTVARRGDRSISVNPISNGLQGLSNIGDGICVISASGDNQYSQESHKWGGGHGVFTYFLLQGLAGEADYNRDKNVNLGELIPYLSQQVRRETRNAQSPNVAGRFDPAISIGR